jgi:hypothetical protein
MTLPSSREAYADYYKMWDLALADPSGCRFRCESHDGAVFHRTRLHMARTIHKAESRDLYPVGDPRHGVSPYDRYMVTIRPADSGSWLILSPRTVGILEVESLSGTEYDTAWLKPALEHERPPQLTSPTGMKLLETNSGSISDVPSGRSSSKDSTTPDKEPAIPGSRRL